MARGGGMRNPANQPRDQQVSRKVSWLLRHGAGAEGLKLGEGGYVNVGDALNTRCLKALHVTFPELREVVASNDKQRFSMIPLNQPAIESESDSPSNYLIRANQGHSLPLSSTSLLTPITHQANNIPRTVIHGTHDRAWPLILQSGGLRPMGRNHIHFAVGLPTPLSPSSTPTNPETEEEPKVISGIRRSATVLIYIDIRAALNAGISFGVSENGVVLTEGDGEGKLGCEFFERVVGRGGEVLMEGGVMPEGVVVDVGGWEGVVGRGGRGKGRKRGGGKRGGRGGKAVDGEREGEAKDAVAE
ncbi:hypothetical protein P153DRAFT_324305, partial [Dothidotthia symphoricarpi CBS 119687]